MEIVTDFFFLAPKSLQTVTAAMNQKTIASWQESDNKPRQGVEKQRHYSVAKFVLSMLWFSQWSRTVVRAGL